MPNHRTLVLGAGWSVPFGGFLGTDFTERVVGHEAVFTFGEPRERFNIIGATFESILADVVREELALEETALRLAIKDTRAAHKEGSGVRVETRE